MVKQVEITVFYIAGQVEDWNGAREATVSFNSRRYGEENWNLKLLLFCFCCGAFLLSLQRSNITNYYVYCHFHPWKI